MTYGSFNISGLQNGLASGNQNSLGPFAVPFSATTFQETITVNTTATIAVPATALGVAIIPPLAGSAHSLTFKTVSGDTGVYISAVSPTVIEFDLANGHVPSNIYLVSSGSIAVTVQFL